MSEEDERALQRQMAEIQIKLEANRLAKAEDKKANRFETMMEHVLDRLKAMGGRLERTEQASREKMAVTDQIAGCVGAIESAALGLQGRMEGIERRIEASEVSGVEALRATGAYNVAALGLNGEQTQIMPEGVVEHVEVQLSQATQTLEQTQSRLVSSLREIMEASDAVLGVRRDELRTLHKEIKSDLSGHTHTMSTMHAQVVQQATTALLQHQSTNFLAKWRLRGHLDHAPCAALRAKSNPTSTSSPPLSTHSNAAAMSKSEICLRVLAPESN
jgi:hypothetical protein